MILNLNRKSDVIAVAAASQGKVVGLTSGSYDLFHHMHLVYLRRCRQLCDFLIVGVDSDYLVRATKGSERPKVPEHQRVDIVSALDCVDVAFVLGTVEDFGRAVVELCVNRIFKNDSFKPEEILGHEHAEVVLIPDVIQCSSTTEIIEQIKRGNTITSKS